MLCELNLLKSSEPGVDIFSPFYCDGLREQDTTPTGGGALPLGFGSYNAKAQKGNP